MSLGIFGLVLATGLALSGFAWSPSAETSDAPVTTRADSVQVTIADGGISLFSTSVEAGSASVEAGAVTFEVSNQGTTAHSFAILGASEKEVSEKRMEETIAPGDTGTLEVELGPGTYQAYCPVSGHSEKEGVEFTVEN